MLRRAERGLRSEGAADTGGLKAKSRVLRSSPARWCSDFFSVKVLVVSPTRIMNYPDAVHFQFDSQGVDWQLLLRLFKATNMGGREGDKVRRAFEKSNVVCFAKDRLQLIAAGRALTDGEYHATI